MNYKNTLALLPAAILAACGGGDGQEINEPRTQGSVVYSYPADGQREVSPKADLVLRFSHAVSDDDLTGKIRVTAGETAVPFTVEGVDGNRSLKLSPQSELEPGTEYNIEFAEGLLAEGNRIIGTPNAEGPEGIQFSTRGGLTGIAGLDNTDESFKVAEMIPAPDAVFRPMDISTFRLRLTHPVHPEWKERGGVIEITDSNGETVPAIVLVKGRLVTIDPCVPGTPELCGRDDDFLTPGETYTVSVRNLPGINGGVVESFSQQITPRDTGPRVVLFQEVIDSGLNAGDTTQEASKSKLNGQVVNGIVLNSVLQGTTDTSQQTGGLFAELAFAPGFEADEPLPLRVPKGSLLSSSNLAVRVNGLVPIIDEATGGIQQTGDIKVIMISDATGYLSPNPYTDDQSAPRHVRLFMDVSMNTEAAQPNASLSQDLLGVELTGIALVEDGVLTIDAIGIVEPNLLGQELTDSTIAFRIQADTDATSQLDAADQRDDELEDLTGPRLVSWVPGPLDAFPPTRQDMQRPGDPVVLNFDEPLDHDSVPGSVTLSTSEGDVAGLKTKVDGTVLVINPTGGLEHGVDYTVNINGVSDTSGNAANVPALTFRLPDIGAENEVTQRSPVALTTFPGYPCYVDQTDTPVDLNAGTHGQCADAAPEGPLGQVLPLSTVPKDRPIVVVFSQSMNLDSIRLDETFTVEKVDPSGAVESTVSGRLEKNNQRIRFFPDEPWEIDGFYRYTMSSMAGGECTNGASDNFICGENGLAFKTDLLIDPESVGGPDMQIYFRGVESTSMVFTPLRNLPVRDTNSNYVVDCPTLGGTDCLEPFNHPSDGEAEFLPSENAAKLQVVNQEATILGLPGLIRASVGCPARESCPENKFIYQTYGLNVEVVGPELDANGNEIGVRILLYPTMLPTTSASVFLTGFGAQVTGPQVLRMTYSEPTEDNPLGLVEGVIFEGENGPRFRTTTELSLDAPNLALPDGGILLEHNLYSLRLPLNLEGPITFFDDGRMQIEQRNLNQAALSVEVSVAVPVVSTITELLANLLSGGDSDAVINIPLIIPAGGVYLNFISNPIKEIPEQY
ncbi:Ig-like domain-containing protein [Marinobacter goseongensis]|uniref:Ig-like domain-containing protein n=1 Tax=Marinobacter goseongensis TaxID=453838 RepID=UPI002006B6BE|nr:Ig-like domain-containing protein [Marinobacter goseongensis]MCK7553005.1 Ig-like domain-containing protein [Marinobacter goseongensis]